MLTAILWATLCSGIAAGSDGSAASAAKPAVDAQVNVRVLKVVVVREVDVPSSRPQPVDLNEIHPCGAGMTLLLELTGTAAANAVQYGHLHISRASDDRGTRISADVHEEDMTRINRTTMFFGVTDAPKDGIWIQLPLSLPSRDAKSLSIAGTLDLTAAKRSAIVIAGIRDKSGAVKCPELEKCGLSCNIAHESGGVLVAHFEGDATQIVDVELVTGTGDAGHPATTYGRFTTYATYAFSPPQAAANDWSLRVELATGKEGVHVAFRLVDVPLP